MQGKYLCFNRIDAANDKGIGRFFNDDWRSPNMNVKIVINEDDVPVPLFFARRRIEKNEELVYKYGNGRYKWRMKGMYSFTFKLQFDEKI